MSSTSFNDKVIALTGAAQGIGLATATLLAARGASLSLADVKTASLDAAKQSILAAQPSARILTSTVDVRDESQVAAWIGQTVAHFGRLDGAANVAGVVPASIGSESGLVENADAAEWEFVVGVNLTGVMHCIKYQLREMGHGASMVNVSSIAGLMGRAKNSSYTATKHAVIGLTRSAAKEVGPRGVRVNAICPGRIETPMQLHAEQAAKEAANSQEFAQETFNDVSLRRKGKPDEVAKLIAFLLSDESSYISGNAVSIDGGWNC